MNIEGVNLSSLSPGNSTIEGEAQSLSENGTTPEGFSDALMGQIELLSEAKGQAKLTGQSQNMTMAKTINKLHDIGDLHEGDTEELVALFDKYLPVFNLPSIENAGLSEKTLVMIKKQSSLLGIEQAAPEITSDMIPLHRQVDNRPDSPAITRPLTHPAWSQDLGEQIVWMNNKAIPAAEIRLNPAHLGPISVRIDVNQDQATILFTAQHAEVKDAIEASIPKLREMLGSQQLNLINVNISQNSTPDQGRSHSQTFSNTPENREQGIEGVADIIDDRVVVSKGLLSLYA